MAQLSVTMNTRQPVTLPSKSVLNPKNDGQCMAIITRGGKQTIDLPMPSDENKVTTESDKVVEVDADLEGIGKKVDTHLISIKKLDYLRL